MKLLRLGVANYRSFGCSDPQLDVTALELNLQWLDYSSDIIVVAGENNSGKTSLFNAYRDFRTASHTMGRDDFYNHQDNCPIVMEIELEATEDELEDDDTKKWFSQGIARVRKVWTGPSEKVVKYSFDPVSAEWVKGGFGGWDSILQNRLPSPIHLSPTMSISEIKLQLQKLFKEIVGRYISDSDKVIQINRLLLELAEEIEGDDYIQSISKDVTAVATDIFPDTNIQFQNPVSDKGILPLLDKQADVSLSVSSSPDMNVEKHGFGAQRVFMLSALSVLAEKFEEVSSRKKNKGGIGKTGGGKIIQIEEPELFLSPSAVRLMKSLLYRLSAQENVQVAACTHSPIMIDFSRPRQTVALIDKSNDVSKIYQSNTIDWGKDQAETFKLMYSWNPALSEAIFAKKVVLVEGETEFAVFRKLIEIFEDTTNELEVHVINCQGKGNILHFQKLMAKLGKRYVAIHDLDVKYDADDKDVVRRWNENETIWKEVEVARKEGVDAECAFFNLTFENSHGYTEEKPKMLKAMQFVERLNTSEGLKSTEMYEMYQRVCRWDFLKIDADEMRKKHQC